MKIRKRLNSQEDTYKLAKIISEYIFPGMIIGLSGDLGSGKTTFTKYFAKEISVKDVLNSPTFTILKTYKGKLDLYHMDVYRLEGIGYDYELDDYIYGKGIAIIEWCEYIDIMLPKDILKISFKFIDETTRDVIIEGSDKYEKIVEEISDRYSD